MGPRDKPEDDKLRGHAPSPKASSRGAGCYRPDNTLRPRPERRADASGHPKRHVNASDRGEPGALGLEIAPALTEAIPGLHARLSAPAPPGNAGRNVCEGRAPKTGPGAGPWPGSLRGWKPLIGRRPWAGVLDVAQPITLCVPGRSAALADAESRGRLGSILLTTATEAIPGLAARPRRTPRPGTQGGKALCWTHG